MSATSATASSRNYGSIRHINTRSMPTGREGIEWRGSAHRSPGSLHRPLAAVVDPGLGDLSGPAAFVHGDAGLGREIDAAPPNSVELEGRPRAVLGDRAVLEDDPPAGAEEALEEPIEIAAAADPILGSRRLAEAAVWLERCDDSRGISRGQRRLVFVDDVRFADRWVFVQQRRPDEVSAEKRPLAVVDADPYPPGTGVRFDYDGKRQAEGPIALGEAHLELADDTGRPDSRRDQSRVGSPSCEPRSARLPVRLERRAILDPACPGIVDPDSVGKRVEQLLRVPGQECRPSSVERTR